MTRQSWPILISTLGAVVLLLSACGGAATPAAPPPASTPTLIPLSPTPAATPTSTPSPPPPPHQVPATPEPTTVCDGLSGEIEVRVLVGPAEAVGLEPFAVGSIPFAVTTSEALYVVQGGGAISYADVLVEDWGTYEVSLDMQTTIDGECLPGASGEELQLVLGMSGQQMVEVKADRFEGEYPWAGESSLDLVFPVVEGAKLEGEGWAFVLHPHNR